MPEFLRPGVFTQEKVSPPTVGPVTINTAVFVGVTERGPLGGKFIDHPSTFIKFFGGSFKGSELPDAINDYYGEGGQRAFVVRVVGTGNSVASKTFNSLSGSPAIEVSSLNSGAWGNRVRVTTTKFSTELDAAIPSGTVNVITVKSVRNLERGDILVVDDGTTSIQLNVIDINVVTREVTVFPQALATGIAIDASVATSSTHRVSTTLTEDVVAGTISEIKVADPSNFRPGQIIWVSDGTEKFDFIVDAVEGNSIIFAPGAFPAITAATSVVVSQEFFLTFTFKGTTQEDAYTNLSMSLDVEDDYVENVLNDEGNRSDFISVSDLVPGGSLSEQIPLPVFDIPLEGGLDGATPTDADFIGSNAVQPKTGIAAIEDLQDINIIAVPGITTVAVQKALAAFAENDGTMIAVLGPPPSKTDPIAMIDYRQNDLNLDTSFAALYYPRIKTVNPDVAGGIDVRDPVGKVVGEYVDVGIKRGVHKSPSNVPLNNVLGLEVDISNGDQELLHPKGINCIRSIPGRGIRITGGRTLTSRLDGFHYVSIRRLTNFVKVSLSRALAFAQDEPNGEDLQKQVEVVCRRFLKNLWLDGMLNPQSDFDKAQFVKCDDENNPQSIVEAGRLNVDVGINPPRPAEFILLSIQLFDGSASIAEQVFQ